MTLSISNPPSKLAISSTSFPVDASNNPIASLSFSYTTSDPAPTPASEVINVSSTGDIIPFTVTAANVSAKGSGGGATTQVWLRVTASGGIHSAFHDRQQFGFSRFVCGCDGHPGLRVHHHARPGGQSL